MVVTEWRNEPKAVGGGRSRSAPRVIARFVRTEALEDATLAVGLWGRLGIDEGQTPPRDYLAAYALAGMMLGERLGCDPSRLRLRRSPRGRSELVDPPGARRLRFSISHADGIALCALAPRRVVGAHVGSLRHIGSDPLGLARTVCSPEEIAVLRALPAVNRAERLLYLWSRKAAVARTTGFGFHVAVARMAARRHSWRLASMRLTDYHVATVAVAVAPDDDIDIQVEEAVF